MGRKSWEPSFVGAVFGLTGTWRDDCSESKIFAAFWDQMSSEGSAEAIEAIIWKLKMRDMAVARDSSFNTKKGDNECGSSQKLAEENPNEKTKEAEPGTSSWTHSAFSARGG